MRVLTKSVIWSAPIALTAAFASLCVTTCSAKAAVQCTCPSIHADGKGNSSCSATETGNRCTVDFNRFPEPLEETSAASLKNVTDQPISFPPPEVGSDVVTQAESFDIIDQLSRRGEDVPFAGLLMTYLSVGVASREDQSEVFKKNEDFFKNTLLIILASAQDFRSSFNVKVLLERPEISVKTFEKGDVTVTLSPGCVEAQNSNIWIMYKVPLAPSATHPQCK